jgi:hypothetical protein
MQQVGQFRLSRAAAVSVATVCLAGCAQSVLVQSEFPTPLVEPLPVRVGFIVDPSIRAFQHYEEIPQAATWTIELGDSSLTMFEPLFERMFADVQIVEDLPLAATGGPPLDGVIRPVLERFEFDVPLATRDEFVEVWLQYQINLYEPNGDLIVEWPVTGYGKSELRRANREESVSRAAVIAMREVGAAVATRFAEQPQISFWLEERQDAAAALSN